MSTPPDDITDAELDAMETLARDEASAMETGWGNDGEGFYVATAPRDALRLIAALREARRRHAEHDRDFACWRVGATEVDASRGAAASLDGAPSRAMIERHFAKCGGYWLVSRVDVGGGSLRPMVLRLSTSVDGASEWMRATIPGVDYGAPWNDRPFRAMQGAKFTPLTADGEPCECGRVM